MKGVMKSVAIVGCAVLLATSAAPAQTIRYVDADASTLNNDGLTWCSAYLSLSTGLGSVSANTILRVANGTYKPTLGTIRTISFQMKNGVTIEGGYAGCGAGFVRSRCGGAAYQVARIGS